MDGAVPGRPAIVVVRGAFVHDARLLRAARVLRDLGREPMVIAESTRPGLPAEELVEGIAVRRLAPARPIAWLQSRWAPRAGSGLRTAASRRGRFGVRGFVARASRTVRTLDYHRRSIPAVLRERPALVHCADYNTMWIGLASRLRHGSRVVYDSHELWPDRNGRWEWRPWLLANEWLFCRLADVVVTASPGYTERMTTRYRIPRPRTVRNLPDAAPIPWQPPAEPPVAVYVGSLLPGRGLAEAITAVASVTGVRLRIVGPGSPATLADLRRLARDAGLENRLEIVPPVVPDDVVQTLADATVGINLWQPVCLSYELTFPNKLGEYLAAGLPVLSSDVPVCAAFVREHGIGEVVPARDAEAHVAGLTRLLERAADPQLGERLRRAAQAVSWAREREQLVAAYVEAMRPRGRLRGSRA